MHYAPIARVALAALVSSISLSAAAQDKKPLTFGELQTIRVMAGGLVGETVGKTLGKPMLGIIANRSAVCSTLAGGVGAGFLQANAKGAVMMESLREPIDAQAAVERLLPADALYLAFGGEWKREDNMVMLERVLEELAGQQYKGQIIFHVTTWAQKQPQDIAARNARVAGYLRQADMRVATLNLDAKEVTYNRAALEGDQWKLTALGKAPLRDDLVALFRRQ